VPVLIVVAVIVVIAVVIFLALGRGGGLSTERNDYLPLDLGPVSATDVALLRPPTGLWGYNIQVTDEAMEQIAESIRDRDVRIVALEQLVTDLSRDHAPMPLLASPYTGARHRRAAGETAEAEVVQAPRDPLGTESVRLPADAPATESAWLPYVPETESLRSPFDLPEAEPTRSPLDVPEAESLRSPFDGPEAESLRSPFDLPEAESPRLPFEPPRPGGDVLGPPPEQSHD
jgi:hypothetical protein